MIEDIHKESLHGGPQLVSSIINRQFWIINGTKLIKSCVHKCTKCIRYRASTTHQKMGNLPYPRVSMARPFLYTGVDYAGPILVRTSKGRGIKAEKGYIAIFVCMSTKAVHIEIVSDFTSQGFLAALRRFTSRRGRPDTIWSDNGTNFVGAAAELRALFDKRSPFMFETVSEMANSGIKWVFNPHVLHILEVYGRQQ